MKKCRIFYAVLLCIMFSPGHDASGQTSPCLGWNSFDCYPGAIDEEVAMRNLEAFIEKLKPSGYEYFVIDGGWNGTPGKPYSIDEYGRCMPSEYYFPNGFSTLVEKAHKHGVKFGIHMMRGIPREAVAANTPVKGTKYHARDIANLQDTCSWSTKMYGIDMEKPGAQAYYNSVLELLAEWGVDFVKYDDIVHKKPEILAVEKAIERSGRDIVLSLSPGDDISPENLSAFQGAEMVRITRDIWDLQEDIDITFSRWESMQPYSGKGFWLDMDMIPLGHIRITYPLAESGPGSTRGYERQDGFTSAQKRTFMTQRALAASPLFMGGSLISSPEYVFELITDPDMLACNQNGVTGHLVKRISNYNSRFDIWATPHASNENEGWFGVFNRNEYLDKIALDKTDLGLDQQAAYVFYDVWGKRFVDDADSFIWTIPARDVLFIRYKKVSK